MFGKSFYIRLYIIDNFIWNIKNTAESDPILKLNEQFELDNYPKKINLGVGVYRTDDGLPYVLSCVKKEEKMLLNENKEYLPPNGLEEFNNLSSKLLLGDYNNKFVTIQTISGTGAIRIGAEFISKFYPKEKTIYLPDKTWPIHNNIFNAVNFDIKYYCYYNQRNKNLDIKNLCKDLINIPNNSIILLHTCAHNPTGVDPSMKEWNLIMTIFRNKNHLAFFDAAYQGFTTGDLDKDSYSVRLFAENNINCIIAQSYSKNMGLYGERVGSLSILCLTDNEKNIIKSHLKFIIRTIYSNPPIHGARIVSTILSNVELFDEWKNELKIMSDRIKKIRVELYNKLIERKTPGNWNHIINQIGMFSFLGISEKQVKYLTEKYHVYLTTNSRISLSGLNNKNISWFVDALHNTIVTSELNTYI